MYGIKIEVYKIKGHCGAGLKKGNSWIINNKNGHLIMEDFKGCCPELLASILPHCFVMAFDGKFDWEDNGTVMACCPDPNGGVEVCLKRIPKL